MNDLKLLFKYRLFTFPNRNGTRGGFNSQIVVFLIFTFMIGFFLRTVFGPLSGIKVEGVPVSNVMAAFFLTISGVFFLMSFSATSSYLFMRNEEIDMLLVLPVKRVSIVIYQIAISTVYQGLTLSVFLGIALPFHLRAENSPLTGIPALIFLIVNIVLLASIISVAFGKFMSRAAARKLMFVVQIVSGFMFFAIVQLVPRNTDNIPLYLQRLSAAWGTLSSPVNIFAWSVRASGEPIFLLLSFVMIPVLGYIFFRLAASLKFEPASYGGGRNKKLKFESRRGGPLLRRELKIYKRYEQLIYYLLYPLVFGLIFGLISDNLTSSIFTMVLISTIFTTIQSAFLMGREYPFIETTRVLPVSLNRVVLIKVIVPVVLGTVLFSGVLLTSILIRNAAFIYLVVIPIVFALYITSSLLGVRGVLQSPPDQMDNPNAFMRTRFVLQNQIICMALGFGAIMPLTMLLGGSLDGRGLIIAIAVSVASLAAAFAISFASYRKIMLKIRSL